MFRQGMRELGYTEDQDLSIESHRAQGDPRLLRRLAWELVASRVDVIVTVGAVIRAVHDLTRTIPIVARATDDPVEAGFVRSLAHPGGNITGVTSISARLNAKWLELLRDVLPNIARIGVVWNPESGASADHFKQMQMAAQLLRSNSFRCL